MVYQYEFDFDYEDILLEIVLVKPDNFNSEKEALAAAEMIEARCVLFPDYIQFFADEAGFRLSDKDRIGFTISFTAKVLNASAKKRLGKPLSSQDIELLKKQGILMDTVFSDQYMISPEDFDPINWPVAEIYQYLLRDNVPRVEYQNQKGFSFEYSSFAVKEVCKDEGVSFGAEDFSLLPADAPKGLAIGTPGYGMSFSAKRAATRSFLNYAEDEIIILDPEGAYMSGRD